MPSSDKNYWRKWRQKNLVRSRFLDSSKTLKHNYGITLDQYNILAELQNNKCKVCLKEETAKATGKDRKIKRLAVDHCHRTGKVRGLLCQKCNQALGLLHEDERTIKNLLEYLNSHKENI